MSNEEYFREMIDITPEQLKNKSPDFNRGFTKALGLIMQHIRKIELKKDINYVDAIWNTAMSMNNIVQLYGKR